MNNIIYENHILLIPELPFKLHTESLYKEGIYAHWHENVEFLFCLDGSCKIQCDAKTLNMKKGETVIINPLSLHRIDTDESVKYLCLIIKSSFFAENGIKAEKLFFQELIFDRTAEKLIKNIDRIYKENTSVFSDAEKRLAVLTYLLYICKNFTSKKTFSKPASKSYSAVLNAVKYINNNFSEKLTLDELSEKANYSKYHFARMFKEATGETVFDHINKLRCENARTLLRGSEKSISEISFECGFESPSYFTKTFKNLYGILPTAYRKAFEKEINEDV